ncbi:sialidase [Frog adenovirus 1]|uniref:Sialidase n=1 Tax=Frog adenovirus 1 (strain ATCC VR-896) TaxID=114102 RepID=Q9III6_ADEF1|nr:sialidase [Frog adenovirus 1]AAF86921.1 sialidase [Frog adenovirus 1]
MDFPWNPTVAIPAWPLKRPKLSVSSYGVESISTGPGLSISDNKVTLNLNQSLVVNEGDLGVTPSYTVPFARWTVFESGDLGSTFYRIPFLICLKSGVLIAGGDACYNAFDDFHRTCIAVARSEDGGCTWGDKQCPLVPAAFVPKARFLDACVVEDTLGRVHLFAVYFENNQHISSTDPNWDFVHIVSLDEGKSWSSPSSLKSLAKDSERYYFQSPGNGIVMKDGTVVVPCQAWLKTTSGIRWTSSFIYSKDNGVTWTRCATDLPVNSSENMIAEYPSAGQLIMVAKPEGTQDNILERTRLVYQSPNMGGSWTAHFTNRTIRMRNPCQGALMKIEEPGGKWTLIVTCPNVNDSDFQRGRANIVMQYLTADMLEWKIVGTVEAVPSYGYTCMCVSSLNKKLYVMTEMYETAANTNVALRSSLHVNDVTRYLGQITASDSTNVNLGLPVQIIQGAATQGTPPLSYRYENKAWWIAGQLLPPTTGTNAFPAIMQDIFAIPRSESSNTDVGWVTVFGSKTNPAIQLHAFVLEYYTNAGVLRFRCFANSADGSDAKLSEMKILYIPDTRVAVMV